MTRKWMNAKYKEQAKCWCDSGTSKQPGLTSSSPSINPITMPACTAGATAAAAVHALRRTFGFMNARCYPFAASGRMRRASR